MATIATIKTKVLDILQGTSGYQGAYGDTKVLEAIQDSFDYVANWMFDGCGGYWRAYIDYVTTASGGTEYALPTGCVMIREVRYLVGDKYIPLSYDEGLETVNFQSTSGVTQYPTRYRIVNNKIYFNPALGVGGTNYLQLEFYKFPAEFTAFTDNIPDEFDRAFTQYIKWRSAGILASSRGMNSKPWENYELEWKERMLTFVNKRVNATKYIRDFEG